MDFLKKIVSKKTVSVLDCDSDRLVVLIAAKAADGTFQILGGGESVPRGIDCGEIRNLGDAVESLMDALRKAENSSGVNVDSLYFNFDDVALESRHVHYTKNLSGEGEIQTSDLDEAVEMAVRQVGQFEKSVLYCKPVGFVIDDRDRVENPVGVFGRKLDVEVYVLQARSDLCDAWQKLIQRCHLARGVPIPSVLSTAYGILPADDRQKKRLIADAGGDFLNLFIFGKNILMDHRIFLTKSIRLHGVAFHPMLLDFSLAL